MTASGSYDPARTTAGGVAAEVERLEAQARLSFVDEFRVIQELGVRPGVLLELGAGSGAVTRRLLEVLGPTRLIALDVNPELLSHARSASVPLLAGDARALPLGDDTVDTVLLRLVLQHIADPPAVLAEVRRVLRPGGRVIVVEVDDACWGIADPLFPELSSVHAKVADAQRTRGGDRTIGRRLTRLLSQAGFLAPTLRLFATTSDEIGVDAFAAHLGPQRLAPLVSEGVLSLPEFMLAADRWNRFRQDPDAWVMLAGFIASATAG